MNKLTIFQNEEAFQKIFEECLGTMPQATEAIKSSYEGMDDMFNKYLEATEEWIFRYAYECDYRAAMAIQKGGAA